MQAEHDAIFASDPMRDPQLYQQAMKRGSIVCCDDPTETFTPEQVATLMQVPIEAVAGALSRDGMIEGLRFSIYRHVVRKYGKRRREFT